MLWVIGGLFVVVMVGVWLLMPTARAIARSDFEPASRDDESVFVAQSTGVEHAGI